MTDYSQLSAPFPADDVDWRVGQKSKDGKKTTLLAYLTARAVMDRLDQVCGPDGWRDSYTPVLGAGGKTEGFLCDLALRVERQVGTVTVAEWVSKSDIADNTDIEALKGGVSGALKRAAVKWGIGRYLYGLDQRTYFEIQDGWPPRGSSAIMVPTATGVGHVFPPALPAWALPPKAKETKEEKAKRQEAHDPSFTDKERARHNAVLSEIGIDYERVCELCAFINRARPSHMTQAKRDGLETFLRSPAAAEKLQAMDAAKKPSE